MSILIIEEIISIQIPICRLGSNVAITFIRVVRISDSIPTFIISSSIGRCICA